MLIKATSAAFAVFLAGAGWACAADVSGTWLTENKLAIVRIADCAKPPPSAPPSTAAFTPSGKLCGLIAWLQDAAEAKKAGFVIGTKVVDEMMPATAVQWDGRVLNDEDNKWYSGKLTANADGTLGVSGCLLLICRGETWVRQEIPVAPGAATGRQPGPGATSQPARAR
jgi:uncharacterized protein (DUF2147 family)